MSDLHIKSKGVFEALMEVKRNSFTLAGSQLIFRLQRSIDEYHSSVNAELEGLAKALEERCAENLLMRERIMRLSGQLQRNVDEIERLQQRIVELGGEA